MAVIVLPTADFSANNIGHIDLFTGFHQTTLGLFTAFSIVPDETSGMQIAVDTFVCALIGAGIWGNDKINALCLPFLTNLSSNPNINDAALNCIDIDTAFFKNNLTSLNLLTKGIRIVENANVVNINTINNAFATDFHFGCYFLDDVDGEDHWLIGGLPIVGISTNTQGMYMDGSNRAKIDSNYSGKPAMRIACYKSNENEGKGIMYCNGQSKLSASDSIASNTIEDWVFGGRNTQTYTTQSCLYNSTVAIISVGKYLNAAEAEAYNNAAQAIIAAVHQYMD